MEAEKTIEEVVETEQIIEVQPEVVKEIVEQPTEAITRKYFPINEQLARQGQGMW